MLIAAILNSPTMLLITSLLETSARPVSKKPFEYEYTSNENGEGASVCNDVESLIVSNQSIEKDSPGFTGQARR